MRFRPDKKGQLKSIFVGILAKAKRLYPSVNIYAFALMSNHLHLQVKAGVPKELSLFMRYLKCELSQRWAYYIRKRGPQWDLNSFKATALPTEGAQYESFKYILSQGVKEGLVKMPKDWPGPHAAHYWFNNKKPLKGYWLNGTLYSKVKYQIPSVKVGKFMEEEFLVLDELPFIDLNTDELKSLEEEIIKEGRELRKGRKVLGIKKILNTNIYKSSSLKKIQWFLRKGTYVAWTTEKCVETEDYLKRYFDFQKKFREASKFFLYSGKYDFPPNSWVPCCYYS